VIFSTFRIIVVVNVRPRGIVAVQRDGVVTVAAIQLIVAKRRPHVELAVAALACGSIVATLL
jgi:hypothetical protein